MIKLCREPRKRDKNLRNWLYFETLKLGKGEILIWKLGNMFSFWLVFEMLDFMP